MPSSSSRRNSRISVIRSHTFNSATSSNSSSMKSPSDERKSRENLTCQSTPQLNCSSENENEKAKAKATEKGKAKESEADESLVKKEETCRLSTNALIPSSTSSLPGLTPPSSGPIDDKNEVCTCSFLISCFFSHSMMRRRTTFLPLDQDVEIIATTSEISFRVAILLFFSSVLFFLASSIFVDIHFLAAFIGKRTNTSDSSVCHVTCDANHLQ